MRRKFKNSKGEKLTLEEISKKTIINVTFSHLSKGQEEKSVLYPLFSKTVQEIVPVKIEDSSGIIITKNKKIISINFMAVGEYIKIPENSYDEESLEKERLEESERPYVLKFNIKNLKHIEWI